MAGLLAAVDAEPPLLRGGVSRVSGSTQVARPWMIMCFRALTCTDVVSEGGLEPLAYILVGSPELWLTV
jgi:hypothetical protein